MSQNFGRHLSLLSDALPDKNSVKLPLFTESEVADGRLYSSRSNREDANATIHSDVISSIVTIGNSVEWSVLRRLKSADVEQSRSGWISQSYLRLRLLRFSYEYFTVRVAYLSEGR